MVWNRTQRLFGGCVGLMALLVFAGCSGPGPDQTGQAAPPLVMVPGNPTCADLGYGTVEVKVEPPQSGTFSLDLVNTVQVVVSSGTHFDWTSTLGIDAVIVKGGDNAAVYTYTPESFGDTGLSAPINPNTQKPYGLSHISFCYDYEVKVSKTADTSLSRTWGWSIDKTVKEPKITLSMGQVYPASYSVTLTTTGPTDSDWAASGTITVLNPAPMAAAITGVTDVIGGTVNVTVTCPVTFPYSLASGASLSCTYTAGLTSAVSLLNVATVTTSGIVQGGEGTAAVDFSTATVNGIDDCVTVSDDKAGSLGSVCAGDAPKTITYTSDIGPYAVCGIYTFVNTASFVTNTTSSTGSDSASTEITVPCVIGCTLTPGYWKTHSSYGPAPYDNTWAQLPLGANTPFFSSGQTYIQVLWTPPKGNAYYILARAYIAAELNRINGADFTAASVAFTDATALFTSYVPADLAGVKGRLRNRFVKLGTVLDDYNNGLIGPGHCSE
jgi:hypothetical protein